MKRVSALVLLCLLGFALSAQAASPAPLDQGVPLAPPAASTEPASAPADSPAATPATEASPVPGPALTGPLPPANAVNPDAVKPVPAVKVSLAVLNLYGEELDIQIGDPSVFSLKALGSKEPSTFFPVSMPQGSWLFFKESDSQDWKIYADAAGLPQALDLADGSRQLLLIGAQGDISFTPLQVDGQSDDKPVVSLVNASRTALETIALTKANTGDVVRSAPMDTARLSVFAPVDMGLYTLSAIRGSEQLSMKTQDGKSLMAVELAPGTWTLAMAVDGDNDTLTFKVWNISEVKAGN